MVLEAAESGHLVFSSLNTVDASKTVERVVSSFSPAEQQSVRERFAKSFAISFRNAPLQDGSKRKIAAVEVMKANARTQACMEKGERRENTLLDAMQAGTADGMQHFDGELARLVQDRVVDLETGISFATNPATLGQELAR